MIQCCCVRGSSHVEELDKSLDELCKEYWEFLIKERPEFAIYRGVESCKGTLDSFSEETFENRKTFCIEFIEKLKKVKSKFFESIEQSSADKNSKKEQNGVKNNTSDLTNCTENSSGCFGCPCQKSAINLSLLNNYVTICHDGLVYRRHLMPYNYMEGPDVYFIKHTLERLTFNNEEDFNLYITLLGAYPKQIGETKSLLREGLNVGVVAHQVSIVPSVTSRLKAIVDCDTNTSLFYQPFLDITSNIDETTRVKLRDLGLKVVKDCVQKPIQDLLDFMSKDYVPQLRTDPAIDNMLYFSKLGRQMSSDGIRRSAYEALLRYSTSLDNLTPLEAHNRGIEELKSVMQKFEVVKQKLKFEGTMKEFGAYMTSLPSRYFNSAEEILEESRRIVFDVIRPKLDQLFSDIPKEFEISIRPFPQNKDVAKAIYNGPSLDGSAPGILWVSTSQPQRYARSELYTLMLHEAEPGHHLQSCMAMKSKSLPLFRKVKDDRRYFDHPGAFPSNEAYSEGWAMYCELLGYELGLFEDPHAEYSHLCSDMIRSCRLIVDTGIHALGAHHSPLVCAACLYTDKRNTHMVVFLEGSTLFIQVVKLWSKEEAVEYMRENTFATDIGIGHEIDRYITWPTQACSYKIGQFKFKELRKRAEDTLGSRFDIREFHQVCLDCGQVPLQILDDIVNGYIDMKKQQMTN